MELLPEGRIHGVLHVVFPTGDAAVSVGVILVFRLQIRQICVIQSEAGALAVLRIPDGFAHENRGDHGSDQTIPDDVQQNEQDEHPVRIQAGIVVGHQPGGKPGGEEDFCTNDPPNHAAAAFLGVVEKEDRDRPDKGGENAQQEHIPGGEHTAHIQTGEPALEHLHENREHHQFTVDADSKAYGNLGPGQGLFGFFLRFRGRLCPGRLCCRAGSGHAGRFGAAGDGLCPDGPGILERIIVIDFQNVVVVHPGPAVLVEIQSGLHEDGQFDEQAEHPGEVHKDVGPVFHHGLDRDPEGCHFQKVHDPVQPADPFLAGGEAEKEQQPEEDFCEGDEYEGLVKTGFLEFQEIQVQDQIGADYEDTDQQEIKDQVPYNVVAGFPVYFSVIHTPKHSTNEYPGCGEIRAEGWMWDLCIWGIRCCARQLHGWQEAGISTDAGSV